MNRVMCTCTCTLHYMHLHYIQVRVHAVTLVVGTMFRLVLNDVLLLYVHVG